MTFDQIVVALRGWVEIHGRLDIPLSRPIGERDIPLSLITVIEPLIDQLTGLVQDPTPENLPRMTPVILQWAETVRDELGVPHLYEALTSPDPSKYVLGLTDEDLAVTRLIHMELHELLELGCPCRQNHRILYDPIMGMQ